jgi:hypothetical protein
VLPPPGGYQQFNDVSFLAARSIVDAVGPAVARCVHHVLDSYEFVLAEIGYQKAVYEVLARVPPMPGGG